MSATLNRILSTGRSAILAQQQAISTASHNTSNVNTEGFSKRDVLFESVADEGGLTSFTVRRRANEFVSSKILESESTFGKSETASTVLSSIEHLFADDEGSIGDSLDAFFNELRELASSPTDEELRNSFILKGETLTQKVSSTAERLVEERRRSDQSLDTIVSETNNLLEMVAHLNKKISLITGTGGDPSDLQDQRNVTLRELAGKIDITTFEDKQGMTTVLLAGAQPLVQGKSFATFNATPDTALGGLRRIDIVTFSGTENDVTDKISGGSLGGTLELRDQTLDGLIDRLDEFAFDLTTEFNAIHNAGYGTDGVTDRNFFHPIGTVNGAAAGMAISTDINSDPRHIAASTTAANAIGGNDNLQYLQALEDQALASGNSRTFGEEIADLVGDVGHASLENRLILEQTNAELENLRALEASDIGVSLDEEMIDLMRFQQAFQAGARIIQTVDEMFQVINQL